MRWPRILLLPALAGAFACDAKPGDDGSASNAPLTVQQRLIASQSSGGGPRSSTNYRIELVIGPEMPVGQASNARNRVLLGPTFPGSGRIGGDVTPRPQPERADYTFSTTANAAWTLDLRRRVANTCTDLLYRRTATGVRSITGTWPALSPGGQYCYDVAATSFAGVSRRSGIFSVAALPSFAAGPTATPNGLDLDVSATASEAVTGQLQFASTPCAMTDPSAIVLDGNDVVTVPGVTLPSGALSVAAWVRPSAANGEIFRIGTRLSLAVNATRNPVWRFTTSAGTLTLVGPDPLSTTAWTLVTGTWDGATSRIYVGNTMRSSSAFGGTFDTAASQGEIGPLYTGRIAAVALWTRALNGTEITAADARGPHGELGGEAGTRASWAFGEASGIQSVYDGSGNHVAATLGASEAMEASDPAREPTFANTAAMGTNATALFTRVLGLMTAGGPSWCYRVQMTTATYRVLSTPLRDMTRNVDTTPPRVSLPAPTSVAECTGNNSRRMTLAEIGGSPTATDNYDSNPTIVPRLGSRMGPVMTFPFTFPLGSTSIYWSATDASGNVGWDNGMGVEAIQVVRIRDTVAPALVGGGVVQIEATSPNGTPNNTTPMTATDTCDPAITVTNDAPAVFPLGSTVVTFTARDGTGNVATAQRTVRVVDTTAPMFNPPLQLVRVAHDGMPCFNFTPVVPGVSDNGYPASAITISGQHISGPQIPCWGLGTHVYRWTISDPDGNTRTGDQTVEVTQGTVNLGQVQINLGPGVTPGRYVNFDVTMTFTISMGVEPYRVRVVPTPTSLTSAGTTYTATWRSEGAYPVISILVEDNAGQVGSRTLQGFGIDKTRPSVTAGFLDQTGVVLGNVDTYPVLYSGEFVDLRRILSTDGAWQPVALGNALTFDPSGVEIDRDVATLPHVPGYAAAASFSVEAWWTAGAAGDPPNSARLATKTTAAGAVRAMLSLQSRAPRLDLWIGGSLRSLVSAGVIDIPANDRAWHHVVGTYDGRVIRMYVDGKPARQAVVSGTLDLGDGPWTLGGGPAGMAGWFGGSIAEFATWSRPLDATTIATQWNGGLGQPIPASSTGLITLYHFLGTGQSLDADAGGAAANGFLGRTLAMTTDDPVRAAIAHPLDGTSSGLISTDLRLISVAGMRNDVVALRAYTPTGTALVTGPRVAGGLRCDGSGACPSGQPAELRAENVKRWNGNQDGAFQLTVRTVDTAGNSRTATVAFRTRDYEDTLRFVGTRVRALIANPLYVTASNELNDALLHDDVALSYATAQLPYDDGSYLRASQSLEALGDAFTLGVTEALALEEAIARATRADNGLYRQLLERTNLVAADRPIMNNGQAFMDEAEFACAARDWPMCMELARDAFDAVALLAPAWRPMLDAQRAVHSQWDRNLSEFSQGFRTANETRTELFRRQLAEQMASATRNVLRDALYPELRSALQNPFTTQRDSLNEILDVIEKQNATADEAGDLISITQSVNDACLDRLSTLDLADDTFTRCYIRLNDMVRNLDRIQEALVHTQRWKAAMDLALFNMLELSMNVSPTGLPWVTSPASTPMSAVLVLPDAQAMMIMGSVRVSTVDFPDMFLARAYSRYAQARSLLDAGDVPGSFALFVAERCLLLTTYNRYYSTNRILPNPGDPKEPPISPASVGCP